MSHHQQGILQALPAHATYLHFELAAQADRTAVQAALQRVQGLIDGERIVLGVGASLATFLGLHIDGLRDFTGIVESKVALPSTPAAVWLWLREAERGALVQQQRMVQQALAPVFLLQQQVDAFKYADGRDLSGYEDGTENPQDAHALAVAINADDGSFVAIQQWQHHFDKLAQMSRDEQDNMIGRRQSDNEELDDAPVSAHVKRTAQEDFEPEAFVVRRSMPWSAGAEAGFYFVAFATSFLAFEAQLRRMSGAEDGITDALFQFTQPITGAYFWCPPMNGTQLSLDWLPS
ncbi:Dyp-type peroxidase [Undibacterium sp. RuRC25W]|uniref:Dyp-type peroxidase n=1 Tax=Undibacterium sp. RuRC25W TaxID=3413047 RepID=UPI003BEF6E91